MKLSILIASLASRQEMLEELIKELERQRDEMGLSENDVEIIVLQDNGKYPIGMKRNKLIEAANGLFVCFIDDDDEIADTYISDIYNTIINYPNIDCVGIKGIITFNGEYPTPFFHSIIYKTYSQDDKGYYRPPNLLNPIKKEIYKNYKFAEISFGEDTDVAMSMCINEALKTEVFIDKVLYYYKFRPAKSEAMKTVRRMSSE
jgi:glycosyltransferase involved in cell wall biosynthesis